MKHTLEGIIPPLVYKLTYSSRKTLGITVTPEMEVRVNAPEGTSLQRIEEKLRKRLPWIVRQQNYFLQFHPRREPRKYISGETHLYLGREYRLSVKKGRKNEVQYKGRSLEIITTDKTKAERVLKNWYRQRARLKFAEIAAPLIVRFATYGVQPTGIYMQSMPRRWGSCTGGGKIILNPELIKAPKPCIEYVILHELCHLVHPNHSARFLALQTKEMPDWEKWKRKLETLLA